MHTKKDFSFLLTIVISMLLLAYITFVTAYEQILSQNNGFFNVIIYGVVLILIFIFVTLFLRVITVKSEKTEVSPVLNVLIIIGILAIFAAFVFFRLGYKSSISPTESYLYRTAIQINNGLLDQAADLHEHILGYPADFIYGYIISNVFSALGADEVIYVILNIGMILIAALFLFLTVNLISTKANATLAVIAFLFMPNNSFLVYSYNSELFVTAIFMISVYLYELLIYKKFKSDSTGRIVALLCGIFSGLLISSEPALILMIVVFSLWVIRSKRQSVSVVIIAAVVAIVEMVGLAFLKSIMMGADILTVLMGLLFCFVPTHIREAGNAAFSVGGMFKGITERFNNPSYFLNENSYFLMKENGKTVSASQTLALSIVDQFIYLFMLILCVLCIVYIIRVSYDKIMPSLSLLIVVFLCQVLGGSNNVLRIYFFITVVLIGSTTLYYMFLNHHPDYAVYKTNSEIRAENGMDDADEVSDEQDEAVGGFSVDVERARALIFLGENEELYRQIKEEERLNRANNSIATTRIKTVINEDGEYDSVEEAVEFFDEPDEKIEAKQVHEVKAIPATRPVEVVKPVLADEYLAEQPAVEANNNNAEPEIDYFDEEDNFESQNAPGAIEEPNVSAAPEAQGFVFRKKEPKQESDLKVNSSKKSKPEKPIKEKPVKKSLKDIKPGEPLPNPLEGPAPSVKKELSFDFDSSDGDDFDF